MALAHSPGIITNGLVFAYDMSNTKKSWKGRPTTNIIGNGCFAGGAGIENESGSYGNNNIVMLLNPGNTPYVLRQGPGGGEYEIHPKAGYAASLNANTTYCMSIWVAYTSDWNGKSLTLHSRWYDGAGNPYTTATDGTIFDTLNLGLVWQRRYTTFTTPSTVSGSYQWYLGYPTDNTTGFRYITGVQLEEGTFPTAFVDGTRSNTQAIVDLVSNNTVTANSLTYNSDGTISFLNNSGFSIPSINFADAQTIEIWLKPLEADGNRRNPYNQAYAGYGTWTHEPNGTINYYYGDGGGDNSPYVGHTSSFTVAQNEIACVCTTRDLTTSWWYKNGVQYNSYPHSYGSLTATPGNITIGNGYAGAYYGDIYAVKLYNRALSAAEVKQNFNALRGRYSI